MAALSLFFKTFEERNLLHGVPIGSAGAFQQKEFTVFGRLLLHSLHGDRPTGIFIAPPIYLAALGKLDAVDMADWGGKSMEKLAFELSPIHMQLEQHVRWLRTGSELGKRLGSVTEYLKYLKVESVPDNERWNFAGDTVLVGENDYALPDDGALVLRGEEMYLTGENKDWYTLLGLHRAFFHPKRLPLLAALRRGFEFAKEATRIEVVFNDPKAKGYTGLIHVHTCVKQLSLPAYSSPAKLLEGLAQCYTSTDYTAD